MILVKDIDGYLSCKYIGGWYDSCKDIDGHDSCKDIAGYLSCKYIGGYDSCKDIYMVMLSFL